jgi:hypothetical protein
VACVPAPGKPGGEDKAAAPRAGATTTAVCPGPQPKSATICSAQISAGIADVPAIATLGRLLQTESEGTLLRARHRPPARAIHSRAGCRPTDAARPAASRPHWQPSSRSSAVSDGPLFDKELEDSGIAWTHLQPVYNMQNFPQVRRNQQEMSVTRVATMDGYPPPTTNLARLHRCYRREELTIVNQGRANRCRDARDGRHDF